MEKPFDLFAVRVYDADNTRGDQFPVQRLLISVRLHVVLRLSLNYDYCAINDNTQTIGNEA